MYNPLVRPRESTRARGRRDSACGMPPPRSRRRAPLPPSEASCARSCHVAAAQRATWPPRTRGDVDALAVVVPHTMLLFPSPSRSRRNHDAITSSSHRHQRTTSSRGARLSRAQATSSCCAQAESLDAASSSRASRLRARMCASIVGPDASVVLPRGEPLRGEVCGKVGCGCGARDESVIWMLIRAVLTLSDGARSSMRWTDTSCVWPNRRTRPIACEMTPRSR